MPVKAALAAASLLVAGLAGCGGDDGGDGGGDDPGGLTFGSGVELPADFPDEVPLIEDGLVTGTTSGPEGSRGWQQHRVSIESEAPYDDLEAEAVSALTEAGFEELGGEDSTDGYFVQTYKAGEHVVLLGLQESTDSAEVTTSVDYLVTTVPETGLEPPETVVPLADGLIFSVSEEDPINVNMLLETSVEETVAAVEAQLNAAGFSTSPDHPVTAEDDGAMSFSVGSEAASVALWVTTDHLTGLTDLGYDIYEN